MVPVSTDSVWRALDQQSFAVLSWAAPKGEVRSAGIIYIVKGRKLVVGAETNSWKARQIRINPHQSTCSDDRGV